MSPLANRLRKVGGGTMLGIITMIAMLAFQGFGFVFTTNLAPLQASAAIAVLGTPVIALWALKQHGWAKMRPSLFTKQQRRAVYRIALGSFFVNICAPLATALLGAGPAATATTVGSLMVGLLLLRGLPPLLMRAVVVIGVILSTNALAGHLNVLGVVAAALAAWHFWNLPGCLKMLGAGGPKVDDRSDQGMVWANVLATPFVFATAVGLSLFQDHIPVLADMEGTTWKFGSGQLGTMAITALFVMVIPVFLTNFASRILSKDNVGAMSSMAAPVYALVGVAATAVGFAHLASPITYQWVGFFVVTLVAASVVLVAADKAKANEDLAAVQRAKDEFESCATGLSPEELAELRSVGCTSPAELIEVGRSNADVRLVVDLMRVGATSTEALTLLATSPSAENLSRYLQLRSVTRASDGARLSHDEAREAVVELSNVKGREAREQLGTILRQFQGGGAPEQVLAVQAPASV
ncbi:hypothetical protein ACRYCC_34100 [Actinomadura scrupuli]|uniref:hypothetical protein n=1 Tax=Actinomadura scrupuli TaxID=559629 RepID=UPI003D98B981